MINKKSAWLLLLGIFFTSVAVCLAQAMPSPKVKMDEFPLLSYPVTGPIFQLSHTWKYQDGDNKEYAQENFDDSSWKSIEVGEQKLGGGWRWYRIAFDLPKNLEGKNLLFDLGSVSVYDEVFVNGAQVGHYGNPPPNFVTGASDIARKYPVGAKYFHPGRNVVAVRVYLGYKGGLYQGNYTLQALTDDAVIGKMELKTSGANALETLLTASPYLNTFAPGSNLLIAPSLTQLFGAPRQSQITATMSDDQNKTLDQKTANTSLEPMQWNAALLQFKTPNTVGDYHCDLSAVADGKVIWQKKLPFHVRSSNSLDFNPKVDASLNQFDNQTLPIQVSQFAMGHFGPRDLSDKGILFDDLDETDARSGLAYSAQILKRLGAPRLFLANTRPVPVGAKELGRFHRAAGATYDGLNDTWVYGFVRPNRVGDIKDLSIKNTSWAKRTYHYEYQNNSWMDFSISAISPAWQATSNAQKMRVFEDIEKQGIGLPTHLAYQSKSGEEKVVDAKKGIQGSDMGANWVLAWFNGGQGWDEFDTPYLFVLQNRPDLVQCFADSSLFFNYPTEAGSIQGMPLYGETLQRPDQTAGWASGLPADVQARCRYWSQVLVNAPDEVKRTAKVDYAKDQLTVKDEFSYLDIKDAWNTRGIKIAPVSPMLALVASSGNIDIAVSKPTKDLEMATLQGPLVAADNAQEIVFRVNGMLHYIRQVRDVKQVDNAQTQPVQTLLNQLVQKGLDTELKTHPWDKTYDREEFMPGLQQRSYTNLLLTLSYLNPTLRVDLDKEIKTETEKYFLYGGIPGPELAPHLKAALRDIPAITVITNPVTGLKLGVTALSNKFGIDQPYWTSTNLYMAWLYADTFDRYDWLKENYPTLEHYFNNLRNSHDWDTCVSWDSFSGFRVGNGLQEGGGKYAGAVAMARMAHKLGAEASSSEAAYYAVMEAVGLNGQTSASEYLKQRRPWLGSNTKSDDIAFAQELRSSYYAEFNEFAGLSQDVILPHGLLNSTGSYILSPLPEVMRLYQEVWPKFTDDFYDPKYDAILHIDRRIDTRTSMDVFVYMLTKYSQTTQQVFDIRKDLDLDWWDKLPDYRGYLDSQGKIGYRNLW